MLIQAAGTSWQWQWPMHTCLKSAILAPGLTPAAESPRQPTVARARARAAPVITPTGALKSTLGSGQPPERSRSGPGKGPGAPGGVLRSVMRAFACFGHHQAEPRVTEEGRV